MATQDTTELLAQLRGIHLPEAPAEPALWPVIIAVIIIAIAIFIHLFRHYRRRTSWAKQAIVELDNIKPAGTSSLHQIAVLLKRIVLTHDKNNEAMHLNGECWLSYLDSFFSTRYFSEGNGQIFGSALYQKHHQPTPEIYSDLKKLIRKKDRSQRSRLP